MHTLTYTLTFTLMHTLTPLVRRRHSRCSSSMRQTAAVAVPAPHPPSDRAAAAAARAAMVGAPPLEHPSRLAYLSMYHPRYPEGGSCGRGLKLSESNSNASDGRRISSFLLASENKPFCRAMASRLPPNGGASDCCMAAHAAGRGPIVARSHVPADSAQSPAPEVMAPSGMLRSRTPGAGPGPARTLSAPCFKNGLPPILAGARSLFLLLKERWRHGMLLKLSWVFQLLP
eukprot:CAMPEP_0180154058 /NCGR_PEP_ID=MMETSP0986-20121125/23931_1 /TAXON_ID=697907 /ORGANISM="non described non described, Strain CCMP2293" /LENGTH=229 /DNA_ID=CAMNT_0022102337 /DNA_START=110 /DNA_END=800 /DNA_ORIENTATION=-